MTRIITTGILFTLAACGTPGQGVSRQGQSTTRREIDLSGGATIVVIADTASALKSITLDGILIETDGVSLEFQPTVVWNAEGDASATVRFRGTVHEPVWVERPATDGTVLPVVSGSLFISIIGDATTVPFLKEQALSLAEGAPRENPYRFEASFSLEPPVLEHILASEQLFIEGGNPRWRVLFGDSERDDCRAFIEEVMRVGANPASRP